MTWFFILAFVAGFGSPNGQLAQRTGRNHCWVQFQMGNQKKLCVGHELWVKWLGFKTPEALEEELPGVWRSFSPLENFHSHSGGGKKPVVLTKYLVGFKGPGAGAIVNPRQSDGFRRGLLLRQWVELKRERASELLAPADHLGIVRSLVLSEGTSHGVLPVFRRLGFVHLVSASGIHLYAIVSWVQALMQRMSRLMGVSVFLGLWISRMLSLILCLILWVLGGARLGMLRPGVVIALRSLAQNLGIGWARGAPLVCALGADLVMSWMRGELSRSGTTSGRWVYALAVGGGLFWHDSIRFKRWGGHLGLALGSWVLVALVEIWETSCVSLATPLLSLITLPWVCLVIYPVTVLSLILSWVGWGGLAQIFLQWACSSLEIFIMKLTEWALWPGNLWIVSRAGLLVGVLGASLIFFASSRWSARLKVTGASVVLLFLLRWIWGVHFVQYGPLIADQVVQLDVGQGDSALVLGQAPGLIDVGSEHALRWEEWLTVFAKAGVSELSWIGLTHLDEDHAGALKLLVQLLPIRCIATSKEEAESPRGQALSARLALSGLTLEPWAGGCVPYPTLGPEGSPAKKSKRGNENMSAIGIPLRGGGFYLSAGDADQNHEYRIGQWARTLLIGSGQIQKKSRLLKISHHGSRYSTSVDFLKLIDPTEVWISSGQGNRYGHPAVQTLNILRRQGLRIRRTDEEGSLVLNGGSYPE